MKTTCIIVLLLGAVTASSIQSLFRRNEDAEGSGEGKPVCELDHFCSCEGNNFDACYAQSEKSIENYCEARYEPGLAAFLGLGYSAALDLTGGGMQTKARVNEFTCVERLMYSCSYKLDDIIDFVIKYGGKPFDKASTKQTLVDNLNVDAANKADWGIRDIASTVNKAYSIYDICEFIFNLAPVMLDWRASGLGLQNEQDADIGSGSGSTETQEVKPSRKSEAVIGTQDLMKKLVKMLQRDDEVDQHPKVRQPRPRIEDHSTKKSNYKFADLLRKLEPFP